MKTKKDHSFGIIPLQKEKNKWMTLLVHHQAGHWAFPKGHPHSNETPHEAAKRELLEETGLHVLQFFPGGSFSEHYFFTHDHQLIDKTVEYYAALVEGVAVPQLEEVIECRWFLLEEAEKQITFFEGKQLCQEVVRFMKGVLP